MRARHLFLILLVVSILMATCCVNLESFPGKTRIALRLSETPSSVDPASPIPERPLEVGANAVVIYSVDGNVTTGDTKKLIINYYTKPEPAGFKEKLLERLAEGAVIGVSDYRLDGNNVTVSIGNAPDWENYVFMVYGPRSPTPRVKAAYSTPKLPGFLKPIKPVVKPVTKELDLSSFRSIDAAPVIRYLGFVYDRTYDKAADGPAYWTGETFRDRKVYVSASGSPGKVPQAIFLKDLNNNMLTYKLRNIQPVYAYVLCGTYGVNESVGFGLANDGEDRITLNNAAPWTIERYDAGAWKTVYSPMSAQVITYLDKGKSLEWRWDQMTDDGTHAAPGRYRVVIDGRHEAEFTVAESSPVVNKAYRDYDLAAAVTAFEGSPSAKAFGGAYNEKDYNASLRDDLVSLMQFKAWMKGLDPEKLKAAIRATDTYTEDLAALPAFAAHGLYEGKPAWFIVVNWGSKGESLRNARLFIFDDKASNVLYASQRTVIR